MLICPECKYENPDHNKFCQNCGTSLTHTDCDRCGAKIAFTSDKCDLCGASNTRKLLALVTLGSLTKQTEPSQKQLASSSVTESTTTQLETTYSPFQEVENHQDLQLETEKEYLDSQKRYYISQEGENNSSAIVTQGLNSTIIPIYVIDKYPLQEPSLNILRKTQKDLFIELEKELNSSYLSLSQYWNLVGVPTHALPYLILQKYAPIVPAIHDAWQNKERGVVLLPDRSSWESLTELWSRSQLPLLQILWSLGEMAKLWIPLSQIGCARSLLIQNNLKVDEDQSFCLEQLYLDLEDNQPTLSDLAHKWQIWLTESQQNYPEELISILEKAIAEEISDIEELLAQLHQIVDTEEAHLESVGIQDVSWEQIEESEDSDIFKLEYEEDSMIYESGAEDQATAMLSMQLASVTDANYTDIGSQRDHNEDFFGVQTTITQKENPSGRTFTAKGLYLICDGMGGHAAGEVASAMAVETLQNYFHSYWQEELPTEETIQEGIFLTNQVLYQTNLDNARSGNGRMGTTLVMALLQNDKYAIAHVGDSRIYRVTRKYGLEQLTVDHEVGQREINRGVEPEIAYARPDAYQLTQALGPRESKFLRPSIQFFNIEEDCLLLLCSDGLSDNQLIEKHWETYLKPLISSSADLKSGLFELIKFADHYNGHDNITGILVRIKLRPDLES